MKAAVLFALAFAAAPAPAQDAPPAPNRFAASIAPAERYEVGGMLVERHGPRTPSRAGPLVLVPGLASGPWAWQDLVRRFKDERSIHVLTLPGFDGRPAPGAVSFDAARADLNQLVRQLNAPGQGGKPVLIGHSMGGALALAVAQDQPGALAGVISVDGLPVFPGTEDLLLAQRPQLAAGIRSRMDAAPPADYAEQQRQYMRTQGVVDMGKADELAGLALRSDRAAVGSYMADLFALDLRPGLPSITAPVLVLVPYFEPDAGQQQVTAAMKLEHYRRLMAGPPDLELAPVANARHFLMIDQPQALADAVRRFIHRP